MIVTRGTLLVAVVRLESQLRTGFRGPVVPGMVLAVMPATTRDARLISVPLTNPSIKGLLSFLHPLRFSLELLPSLFELLAFLLGSDRSSDLDGTGGRARLLQARPWLEGLFATLGFAFPFSGVRQHEIPISRL